MKEDHIQTCVSLSLHPKREVVSLAIDPGCEVSDVLGQLDFGGITLKQWVKHLKAGRNAGMLR